MVVEGVFNMFLHLLDYIKKQ